MNVDPVESIGNIDYDHVLIATVDSALAQKIKDLLLDMGLSPEKILVVHCPVEIRENLLYLFLGAYKQQGGKYNG